MAARVNTGARIVRTVVVMGSFPLAAAVVLDLLSGRAIPVQAWLRLVVLLALSWSLLRGSEWARGCVVTGFALSGVAAVLRLAMGAGQLEPGGVLALMLNGAISIAGAVVVGWSAAVQAYFDRQNQPAVLDLSPECRA